MFTSKAILVLALAFVYICGCVNAQALCRVQLKQTLSATWTDTDGTFSVVQVAMENSGSSSVKSLTLLSGSDFQSFWEMNSASRGEIVLPTWRVNSGIKVGETHSWGYIIKSSRAADLVISEVQCVEGGSAGQVPSTRAPTTRPTSAPTTRATPTPTTRPTAVPTSRATSAPTTRPTTRPTSAPTTRPTSAPTTRPTSAPTTRATPAPTTRATSAPTTRPTSAPPTNTGGRVCPDGQIWSPAPGTTWQWQLTGTIDQSIDVQMYDVDLFDTSSAVIQQLHSKGRVVICYFSTQYENWRPDASSFPSSALGANLDDWPGERYVDIRNAAIRNIMAARMDLAKSKGCDGVEPDNIDGYANPNGLGLTAANQLDYNKFLAQQAHARGLSIGLKNDLDQVNGLVSYFDWALNEQCNAFSECSMLNPFVTAGKAVFGVEYAGSASSFCPSMNNMKFSWLKKEQLLGASLTQCCASAAGGCKSASYQCLAPKARRAEYAEAFTPDAELQAIEDALAPNPFEEDIAAELVAQEEAIVADAELVAEPVAQEEAIVAEVFAEPIEEVVA